MVQIGTVGRVFYMQVRFLVFDVTPGRTCPPWTTESATITRKSVILVVPSIMCDVLARTQLNC